jgi:hypothetical protein
MATADQIRAAAAGYASTDDDAAKRLRDAQALVFGQAAQQVGSTAQAQQVAPALVQAGTESDLKSAQDTANDQVQAGEAANQAEAQKSQQALEAQGTALQLGQTKAAAGQQVVEAGAEAAQRKQMTTDEQASAQRLQAAGLAYDANLAFMSRTQRDELAKLGRDVKEKLFTDRLTFEQDEAGRKFANERQLADYTVANAKSQDALKDKVQQVQQAQQNKEYMVDKAFQVVGAQLEQALTKAEQARNQVSVGKIQEMQRVLKREAAARAAKAGAMGATISGVVSGAGTGAMVGGPWGAVAGAVIGGAAGYASSQQGE